MTDSELPKGLCGFAEGGISRRPHVAAELRAKGRGNGEGLEGKRSGALPGAREGRGEICWRMAVASRGPGGREYSRRQLGGDRRPTPPARRGGRAPPAPKSPPAFSSSCSPDRSRLAARREDEGVSVSAG
jgi:hypothetical protein